ncbi:hypothetical protein LPTSP4_12000 [Leptospira ryugenii]|uniref:Uncharacterized protein n=1 Tax=Leptospira ryugenii TaxID=1917863 RepID=A0A2P2DYI1_9LEPT|nr:hypothetical protein [Leptospira ryugenii]GBF49684.1 hypothetical protein LPTSP4_12000 [Leptospira ryugenii]
MHILRLVVYFFCLFLFFESIALSAVMWSFYESTKNALQQEEVVSEHRIRDLVLALAKASEVRIGNQSFSELNTTYSRYVELTKNDPETFFIHSIKLYQPNGLLLASSKAEEVKEELKKRSVDEAITKEAYFRKANRMKKWEWSESEVSPKPQIKSSEVKLPEYAKNILKLFPGAKAEERLIYAPIYHEEKLDVLAVILITYQKANLLLLLENQFELMSWLLINYSTIAFIVTIVMWLLFFLFIWITKSNANQDKGIEKSNQLVAPPPVLEKKTFTNQEVVSDLKAIETEKAAPAIRTAERTTIQNENDGVIDAIYLG